MLSSPDWKLTLVTNHQVSLQCPTAEYPYTAQPQSVPAVLNHKVSLQCPTAKYPCSAQLQSIPPVSNHQISLQGPTEKYPCSAQAQSTPGVPNSQVSMFLQRICSAARKTVEGRGAGKRYTSCAMTALGWGCSQVNNLRYRLLGSMVD